VCPCRTDARPDVALLLSVLGKAHRLWLPGRIGEIFGASVSRAERRDVTPLSHVVAGRRYAIGQTGGPVAGVGVGRRSPRRPPGRSRLRWRVRPRHLPWCASYSWRRSASPGAGHHSVVGITQSMLLSGPASRRNGGAGRKPKNRGLTPTPPACLLTLSGKIRVLRPAPTPRRCTPEKSPQDASHYV
jgi:hypothetical protein